MTRWILVMWLVAASCGAQEPRPRVIMETDAGGDPDDEQSLVRLLVYANEFDVDGDTIAYDWFVYGEAGTYRGEVSLNAANGPTVRFTAPEVKRAETVHVLLRLRDDGAPPLCTYRRAVVTISP